MKKHKPGDKVVSVFAAVWQELTSLASMTWADGP